MEALKMVWISDLVRQKEMEMEMEMEMEKLDNPTNMHLSF